MQPLILINNVGEARNLCFVNCTLQALNILPEFHELCLGSKMKGSPIGQEICALLESEGKYPVSGEKLRK